MKLLLLGTVGYHPNDRGHTTCFLLPEVGVMLDAGTATFRISKHLQTPELDIFLTHTHLDHVAGLTYLLDVLHGTPVDRVRVHGESRKLEAVERHLFSSDLFPVAPPYEACPLTGPLPLAQGGRITHFPLEHPGGAVGYRLDWPDRSLALVTDTVADPDAPYVEAIRGVDVLIHECYFPDSLRERAERAGHSCTTPVAQVAAAAGVGRLILVHLNPSALDDDPIGLDVARRIFPSTDIGRDAMEVDF